jgi:hypothetical protein
MYHVLKCSGAYVMFISISCHSPSDAGGSNAYTLTALQLFLLHKEFNHCTLATNVIDSHTFTAHCRNTN